MRIFGIIKSKLKSFFSRSKLEKIELIKKIFEGNISCPVKSISQCTSFHVKIDVAVLIIWNNSKIELIIILYHYRDIFGIIFLLKNTPSYEKSYFDVESCTSAYTFHRVVDALDLILPSYYLFFAECVSCDLFSTNFLKLYQVYLKH